MERLLGKKPLMWNADISESEKNKTLLWIRDPTLVDIHLNTQPMDFRELVESLALGALQHEVLRASNNGLVARIVNEDGASVVAKLWKRPGVRSMCRRLTRTGNVDREWQILNHLYKRGLPVPRPLEYFRFNRAKNGYTDAIVLQDLGRCPRGIDFLPQVIAQGREKERVQFENHVIILTKSIIDAGVLDSDHHMVNILALPTSGAARIDFEIASIVHIPRLFEHWFSRMLSRLMATYVFAVQPHLEYADLFAIRLKEHIDPTRAILQNAKLNIDRSLEKQRKETGLDTHWTVPW